MIWAKEVDGESASTACVSSRAIVTERQVADETLTETVKDLADQQRVLSENMALQQATVTQLLQQQQELLSAVAGASRVRHETAPLSQRSGIECFFCHKRGHLKRDCFAFQRTQERSARHNSGNWQAPP